MVCLTWKDGERGTRGDRGPSEAGWSWEGAGIFVLSAEGGQRRAEQDLPPPEDNKSSYAGSSFALQRVTPFDGCRCCAFIEARNSSLPGPSAKCICRSSW